jgi:L-alanine-DL-glutamate epimerase-like enolase superfamily enzyme
MMRRREFVGLGSLAVAAAGGGATPLQGQPPVRPATPLKITKVEAFVMRHPKDNTPEEDHIVMPPVGTMNEGVGLWRRLDHATPSRFKQYQQFILVRVTTDQGIMGWGEGHAPAAPRVQKTVVSDLFAPILMGQDARNVEVLWEKLYSSQRLRGYSTGFYMEALSAIDLALWDVFGKYVGLPLYRLLGGKYRDEIPTYLWIHGNKPADFAAAARAALSEGYTVVKMQLGMAQKGASDMDNVLAASEAVGKKGQVIVDSLGTFKLYEAVKIGRELDRLGNIGWWEDPLMPEDSSGYPKLADALDTAICKGEVLSNRFQMRDHCIERSMDISNIDLCRAGGITESRRMAMIADVFGLMWTPHVSMGSVPYMAASIHLAAATPNCLIVENANQASGPFGNILLRQPIEYRPGSVRVPERPGLGIEFNEAELEKITIG